MAGVHLRVLQKAVRMAGGREALAESLKVSPGELEKWLLDEAVLPIPVFLRAIDVALGSPESDAAPTP